MLRERFSAAVRTLLVVLAILAVQCGAIRSGDARDAVPEAGWLGIEFGDLMPADAEASGLDAPAGARLFATVPHGPAARAGLKPGDVLLAVNGRVALDQAELADLLAAIWPGRKVAITVLRAGAPHHVELVMGRRVADNLKPAEAGDAAAMFEMGLSYETGRGVPADPAKAVPWYRKAAEKGYAHAQFALGVLYGRGIGVAKDQQRATAWTRRAAEQGNAAAQLVMAWRYQFGRGVEKDYAQARHWYRAAAEQGEARGFFGLAKLHENAIGVPEDAAAAVRYYRRAVELGHVPAHTSLARMLWRGTGVAQDKQEAARLWRRAALRGAKAADQNLRKLKLDPFDAAEIQRVLAVLGYDPGPADGKPGPRTRAALEQYQADEGLTVDGELSQSVAARLLIAEQTLRREALAERFGVKRTAPGDDEDEPADTEDLDAF